MNWVLSAPATTNQTSLQVRKEGKITECAINNKCSRRLAFTSCSFSVCEVELLVVGVKSHRINRGLLCSSGASFYISSCNTCFIILIKAISWPTMITKATKQHNPLRGFGFPHSPESRARWLCALIIECQYNSLLSSEQHSPCECNRRSGSELTPHGKELQRWRKFSFVLRRRNVNPTAGSFLRC